MCGNKFQVAELADRKCGSALPKGGADPFCSHEVQPQ